MPKSRRLSKLLFTWILFLRYTIANFRHVTLSTCFDDQIDWLQVPLRMETFAQSLAPQILAIQYQQCGWNDGWSDGYAHSFACNKDETTVNHFQPCERLGEDLTSALPDELLERIFSLLPVSNVFRAGAVCKRWHSLTISPRFLGMCEQKTRPWYFMYKDKDAHNLAGLAYDPVAKKWHNFRLPCLDTSSVFVASADGLLCFLDSASSFDFYVCNPITRSWTNVPCPIEKWSADYYSVSMIVDNVSKEKMAILARCNQVPDNYTQWNLTIEVFDMKTGRWRMGASHLLHGWRGGDNSVICNGVFYYVAHSTAMLDSNDACRHRIITYHLSSGSVGMASIAMPCSLTCVRLMNCNGKLVMVGGIGKFDIIKGIGIWVLETEWQEVARMPNKFFRGFGEFDDVFSSSGAGDVIYIHAFGSPQLLLYDMIDQSWRWSTKCPVVKKHPLHLFTGFCFVPKLGVSA